MNTTQRMLALGGTPQGDTSFLIAIRNNNPWSASWWDVAIRNNPGGLVPKLNPEQFDEMFDTMVSDFGVKYSGGCGSLK